MSGKVLSSITPALRRDSRCLMSHFTSIRFDRSICCFGDIPHVDPTMVTSMTAANTRKDWVYISESWHTSQCHLRRLLCADRQVGFGLFNPLRSHFARYLRGAERSETKEISLKRMRIRNDQKNDRNTIH